MRGILAAMEDSVFSEDHSGVSGAQADGKRVRQVSHTVNTISTVA
jgi:hypothetical protein